VKKLSKRDRRKEESALEGRTQKERKEGKKYGMKMKEGEK